MIKCKICGGEHAGTICTNFAGSKPRAAIAAKVKEIEARPVVIGTKGKAKKAKLATQSEIRLEIAA